jgi:hypothetical protein
MISYTRSSRDKIPYVGNWSFKVLQYFGISSSIGGLILLSLAFYIDYKLAVIALSMAGMLGIVVALVLLIFSRGFTGLARKFGVPAFFLKRMKHVDKLKFATINNLFVNRRNSVTKMITKVLIKQMRWFGFERVYGDTGWKTRLILNATFELTKEEVEKRKKKYPSHSAEISEPGDKIMAVSAKALKMGTTLWFTDTELRGEFNMPKTILACGQFTMCFNLLEYFEKFIYHPKYQKDFAKYSPETQKTLADLHASLLADWKRFKEDPYWMVKELEAKISK